MTAWLRGDIPTELTSNHLSTLRPDRWVDAGGTLVNLVVGAGSLLASRSAGDRANIRYFLWIFAALNLLPGAGYFLFSGIFGFGDWQQVILGLPHQIALRIGMTVFGAGLYVLVVRLLAVSVSTFFALTGRRTTPWDASHITQHAFSVVLLGLRPSGLKLLFVSTIPAAFGGSSGLMWADSLLPPAVAEGRLLVQRKPVWWIAAVVLGIAYIVVLGRGLQIAH